MRFVYEPIPVYLVPIFKIRHNTDPVLCNGNDSCSGNSSLIIPDA